MKQFSLLLGAIAFLAIGTGVATAQGNGALTDKYEVETWIDNPCCDGGRIDVTGTVHTMYNPKTGQSHINYSGLSGTDANGNVYHAAAVGNSSFTYNEEDGSYSASANSIIRFSSSSGCSFTIHYLYTYGWNPVDGYWQDVKLEDIRCEDDLS